MRGWRQQSGMHINQFNNTEAITFNYRLCAVVFGTDETILNLPLNDGFFFVQRSLIPDIDHLDRIFDTNAMGLRRLYETARINRETVNVICIEKQIQIRLKPTDAAIYYNRQIDQDLASIDNQIRAIRLVKECPLRCKDFAIKIDSVQGAFDNMCFDSHIPIGESAATRELNRFHCDIQDIPDLKQKLDRIVFPIRNDTLNIMHRYYDLSYHCENYISITLLIAALEMIFLTRNDNKRQPLSKRCAVYMYDREDELVNCYNKLVAAYKQRSDFVHDGVFLGIDDETILFLRNCVRTALLRIDAATFEKNQFIAFQKEKVRNSILASLGN